MASAGPRPGTPRGGGGWPRWSTSGVLSNRDSSCIAAETRAARARARAAHVTRPAPPSPQEVIVMKKLVKLASKVIAVLAVVALAAPARAADPVAKVDLNKASVEELVKLPRVGPAIAQKIVQYRKDNGGFRRAEDLMNVKGIGKKGFE